MSLLDKRTYAFNGNLSDTTEYCYIEKDVLEAIKELKDKLTSGDKRYLVTKENIDNKIYEIFGDIKIYKSREVK